MHLAVGVGVKQNRAGGITVAASAADLLVVGLHRSGQGVVNDGAHVGFVDAHAKRDGGDDDLQATR